MILAPGPAAALAVSAVSLRMKTIFEKGDRVRIRKTGELATVELRSKTCSRP